jgi:putative transposase
VLRRPVESAQYTSLTFGRRLQQAGLVASMGTVGDALDNAVAESFFATLECELLDRYDWPTRQALRTAVFDFVEVFYNRQRRHSTIDYTPPPTTNTSAHHQHPPHNHRVHGTGATPTSGHRRFRRTAGHRPFSSRSRDDAGGRFRLWSRRSSQQRASTLRVSGLLALRR